MSGKVLRLAVALPLFVTGTLGHYLGWSPPDLFTVLLLAAYVAVGYDVVLGAFSNIARLRFLDERFLMTVASAGAVLIGEYPEGVAVMMFYVVGEIFESRAVERARESISDLMDLQQDYANLEINGSIETVDPDTVSVGDVLVIKPGERIPLDGTVTEGRTSLDMRALTGESAPRDTGPGDAALSGSVNLTNMIRIRVTAVYSESTATKVMDLVEDAASKKAHTEKFITRFSRYYTPAVVASAIALVVFPTLITGQWELWLYRGLTFLVVSCPCALVISVPMAFFSGIGRASGSGIMIKGSNYLEILSGADTAVFDKTGTLTEGRFSVDTVHAVGAEEGYVIEMAAKAELYSDHPLSETIKAEYGMDIGPEEVEYMENLAGRGIVAGVNGRTVHAGNRSLMEEIGTDFCADEGGGTNVHVAVDREYIGHIIVTDTVKEGAAEAVSELRAAGIRRMAILTGDNPSVSRAVGDAVGIEDVRAGLLPDGKMRELENIMEGSSGGTIFVGDGINDAPSLRRADAGIAMGVAGSGAAIEAADVVIMDDDLTKIASAIRISKKTMQIVRGNIVFILGVKFSVLALAMFGLAGMWAAVFADVGVSMIALANSARLLGMKNI
ncbi:MAG: heavy metal translocating P-type ATPase [Candidatus Methanomethylophilaceae archaeon]|jgi:Cd2+/Zn2+-exporting ATPase|nr:zinc ABC transporter ATPase [Methanomassiliicoccales archaeon RumEn M2]MDD2531994.1 heavy metal translocating P-type ATPase [Candidatus Methanomethylophilaceae archaeon]MDI9378721.1 heavy metal translocating P-type ATPase [Candidatus Thermoplasmatota archaeon]MDD3128047.1 heavy metal translocating P-type ATPase [Candidatus Methanomethylophilaceae archaeon]MDD4119914.1 heavy metal translocating P-type ATPase [Candidatus Methanomethylophilaceae archaeon]